MTYSTDSGRRLEKNATRGPHSIGALSRSSTDARDDEELESEGSTVFGDRQIRCAPASRCNGDSQIKLCASLHRRPWSNLRIKIRLKYAAIGIGTPRVHQRRAACSLLLSARACDRAIQRSSDPRY